MDESLYFACKALLEGRIAPFLVGNPFNGTIRHVGRRNAGAYVRAFEEKLPKGEGIMR